MYVLKDKSLLSIGTNDEFNVVIILQIVNVIRKCKVKICKPVYLKFTFIINFALLNFIINYYYELKTYII